MIRGARRGHAWQEEKEEEEEEEKEEQEEEERGATKRNRANHAKVNKNIII